MGAQLVKKFPERPSHLEKSNDQHYVHDRRYHHDGENE
jgi:hypothetical protein